MLRVLRSALVAGSSLAALLSSGAFAQSSADAGQNIQIAQVDTADANGQGLESIVVTAQRREEKVQAVPIAINVISSGKLLDNEVLTANDISRFVPDLTGANGGGRVARPRWFLRGIGVNDPSPNVVSPIGIYIDDVYLNDTAYETFPLFDEERIEVLRGPQGTLWGKNTIGGAIDYISKAPSFQYDGYAKVDFGNNSSKSLQGAVGGPLIRDKLAGRVSFDYEDLGGYYNNDYTGQKMGGLTDEALRAQVLATPTDNLDILFSGNVRKLRDQGPPTYRIGTLKGGADFYGYIPPYGTHPQLGDSISTNDYTPPTALDSEGGLINVKYHLGDYTLTSITAYDQETHQSQGDGDYSPLPESVSYSQVSSHQLSQELRIASPTDSDFSWLAGFHYFTETFNSNAASATLVSSPSPSTTRQNSYQDTVFTQDTESYAVFANATYRLTDDFTLNGGIRFTTERKSINLLGVQAAKGTAVFNNTTQWWLPVSLSAPASLPVSAIQRQDIVWSKPTFTFSPEYEISDNARAYLRYATGFRSGGFNGNVAAQVAVSVVQPETLTDYEAGFKSEWFDHHLIANASAFYYDYSNIQVNIQGTLAGSTASGTTLRNAANAKINGLELEFTALPLENLQVSLNGGYLFQANYTNFKTLVVTNGVAVPTDASGNQIARAAKQTATIDVEYSVPLSWGDRIQLGTDWSYRSHIYFNAVTQNDPLQEQGGYAIGNAHVSYKTADDKLDITAYSTNIANRQYVNNNNVPTATDYYRLSFGPPRTYGISATAKF